MPDYAPVHLSMSPPSTTASPAHIREPKRRFSEIPKLVPVIFILCIIAFIYMVYVFYHCIPLLELQELDGTVENTSSGDVRSSAEVEKARWPWPSPRLRGYVQLAVFHFFTGLLLICYVRSILTHPGEIPDEDQHWEYVPQDRFDNDYGHPSSQETKRSGERRHCKWCGKFKPDRCHHCRVCRSCVLKMDHHCPWIHNCVGFYNYKYFLLLLFYTMADTSLVVVTMFESVRRSIEVDAPFFEMFLLLFAETLSFFLGVLLAVFFCFHLWLVLQAMTTIEFCEKKTTNKRGEGPRDDRILSVYDLGYFANIKAVLGPNVLTWWLPLSPPLGDGLNFVSDETRLTLDMEVGRGIRRKMHQKTQRTQKSPYSVPHSS